MTPPTQEILGSHPDFPGSHVAFDHDLGFYRTFPYPSEESLEHFYTQEYRHIRQENPDENYLRFMRHRAREQTNFILNASSCLHFESVIDIGCGCGELLNALHTHATVLHGFETDTLMASYAKAHLLGNSIKIQNEHFSPKQHLVKCDLITMSHVLEHIPTPISFLERLRTHSMERGGALFVEVPNEPTVWIEKQIEWRLRGLGHLNYFTSESLKSTLMRAGFKRIQFASSGIPVSTLMASRRPRNRLIRKYQQIRQQLFPSEAPLPDYESQGGNAERIYLLALAFND